MPYTTTWHDRGIEWKFSGHVTAAEIERANEEFFKDGRSDNARFQLVDLGEVESVEWEERDIKATAAYDIGAEATLKNIRLAYVTKDDEIRRLLEMYVDISRRLNSSWRFKGFEDVKAAREWARG
ncbi:MAG: hypothetical protein HKN17_09175 [Rhodothermales bacterium]|nr:hypothetical protein [Rhodothermales bacterium]